MDEQVGLDWTGKPSEGGGTIYGAVAVVVRDVDTIESHFSKLRQQWGKPTTFELHGHELTERQLLETILDVPGDFCIVATLFLKSELAESLGDTLDAVVDNPPSVVVRPVLDYLLQRGSLRKLWYDRGDMTSKEAQRAFKTIISREARRTNPKAHVDVRPLPSNKHCLIQLADVFAYAIQREHRGSFKTSELSSVVRQLWSAEQHRIEWGTGNDLRPYL